MRVRCVDPACGGAEGGTRRKCRRRDRRMTKHIRGGKGVHGARQRLLAPELFTRTMQCCGRWLSARRAPSGLVSLWRSTSRARKPPHSTFRLRGAPQSTAPCQIDRRLAGRPRACQVPTLRSSPLGGYTMHSAFAVTSDTSRPSRSALRRRLRSAATHRLFCKFTAHSCSARSGARLTCSYTAFSAPSRQWPATFPCSSIKCTLKSRCNTLSGVLQYSTVRLRRVLRL